MASTHALPAGKHILLLVVLICALSATRAARTARGDANPGSLPDSASALSNVLRMVHGSAFPAEDGVEVEPTITIFYYDPANYAPEPTFIPAALEPQCVDFGLGKLASLRVCIEVDLSKPELRACVSIVLAGTPIDLGCVVLNPDQPAVHLGVELKLCNAGVDLILDINASCLRVKAQACCKYLGCVDSGDQSVCWGIQLSGMQKA